MYLFPQKRNLYKEFIETAILAAFIFLCLHLSIQNYQVEGSSMDPTLKVGECVLSNKFIYTRFDTTGLTKYVTSLDKHQGNILFLFHPPKRGEIVVFRYPKDPNRHFVKRIIGIPGDQVEIKKGVVLVNGYGIEEPYLNPLPSTSNWGPSIIQAENYFVLGDNRAASNDSRSWGSISNEHLVGRYWFKYWPALCSIAPLKQGI